MSEEKSTSMAVASMVMGILSWVCGGIFLAIPAVVCGHIARGKIKRGECAGDGMALAGLITGYSNIAVSVILIPLILAGMLLPALSSARDKARRISDAANMKQIGVALRQYSMEYDGYYPPYDGAQGLNLLLTTDMINNPKVFVCPSTETKPVAPGQVLTEENTDYIYIAPKKKVSKKGNSSQIVLRDRKGNFKNFENVLYINGRVQGRKLK